MKVSNRALIGTLACFPLFACVGELERRQAEPRTEEVTEKITHRDTEVATAPEFSRGQGGTEEGMTLEEQPFETEEGATFVVEPLSPGTGLAVNDGSATSSQEVVVDENSGAQPAWVPLFNGKDLVGWTPKIRGHELGVNFGDTFAVQDGLLQIRFDAYGEYESRFGHLFFQSEFSNYNLVIEYRFVGEQCPGSPGWAWRNNGVMLHSQSPESMTLDQDFPVSIEVQTLGSLKGRERSTANLCSPGTHVFMNGNLFKPHCTDSGSKPMLDDEWVTLLIEVRGHESIRHIMNGEVVLEYTRPLLDENDANAKRLISAGVGIELHGGYIALQAESHPVDYRRVDIQILP